MAAAKRSLSSSSSHHPTQQSSAKRPRLHAGDRGSHSETSDWPGLRYIKDSWDWMMGRRKPARPGPQVRRPNGTTAVGLQLALPKRGGVIPISNGHPSSPTVVELSDDEGDISIDYEREDRQKRQTSEARRLLNDHTRAYSGEIRENVHPNLPQPLFPSAFDAPLSPVAFEPRPPASPVEPKVPNRPNVGYSKPSRDYNFVRPRSSSGNLSVSSSSSSPPRSPRKPSCRSLRNGSGDDRQLAMLNKLIQQDPDSSAPLVRVRDELLRSKQLSRHSSIRSADISQSLMKLQLDHRKTLDDAIEPRREEPLQRKARDRPQPVPFQQVKSGVLEKFRKEREEEERRIAARLRPRVPKDVTPEQNEIVRQRLADPMFKSEAVDAKALRTLKPGVWLNDEIINFYVDALRARAEKEGKKIAVGNSFFYQKLNEQGYSGVKRWGRTRKIPEKDLFIIPVHVHGCHWTCACINFKKKQIEYYDSMTDSSGFRFKVFANLRSYLKEEWKTRLEKDFDFTGWEDVYSSDTPQQNNGSDCGVFACQTMEALARGKDLTTEGQFEFDSSNMPFFRKLMIVEIASGELAKRVWS